MLIIPCFRCGSFCWIIADRHRHLLKDFHKMMPHCRKENKLDSKSKLFLLNEIADIHNCNYTMYLENRKREDLYLWFAKVPEGPSMKFYVQNGNPSSSS